MDLSLLSKLQFGALMAFHLLFPAITLVLGWMLAALRMNSKSAGVKSAIQFWMPIYALTVAFQIVSAAALGTQFDLNEQGITTQAYNGFQYLLAAWGAAFALQISGLAVVAYGIGHVNELFARLAIVVAALGSTLAVIVPLFLLDWIGRHAEWSGWGSAFANALLWERFAHLLTASVITAGFLFVSLSTMRWKSGARTSDIRPTAIGGLVLVMVAAFVGFVNHLLGHTEGGPIPGIFLMIAAFCLAIALRVRDDSGLDRLPALLLVPMAVLPLLGWALLLWEWPFAQAIDQPVARSESIAVTFPLYLGTIGMMVLCYLTVLVTLAWRKPAIAKQPEYARAPQSEA